MDKQLKSTLVEITRAQSRDDFRRDQILIPKSNYQLERINRQLKKLAQEKRKMIVLTNPETGVKHEIDLAAYAELQTALANAYRVKNTEIVFRAMRVDVSDAEQICDAWENEAGETK